MSMILTVGVLSLLPIGAVIVWKCRTHAKLTAVLGGIVGFMLFSRILESIVHMFFIFTDNPVSRLINGSTALYTLYGCAMAGIFEEVGRYIMFRFVLKNDRSPQTAIGYGIGHGGIEVYVNVVLGVLVMLAFSASYVSGMEAAANNSQSLLLSAASFTLGTFFFYVVERVAAMAFHVAASVIVFASVTQRRPPLLPLAVVLHGIVDIPAALTQRGVISVGPYVFLFSLLIAGVCVIAWKVWKGFVNGIQINGDV